MLLQPGLELLLGGQSSLFPPLSDLGNQRALVASPATLQLGQAATREKNCSRELASALDDVIERIPDACATKRLAGPSP